MSIIFRNYTHVPGITPDYFRVREFLVRYGYCFFTYARWDWMAYHSYLDKKNIGKIGVWEDDSKVVAIATFDCWLGNTYLVTSPEYRGLLPHMLNYAEENLNLGNSFRIVIPDSDQEFQSIAAGRDYIATYESESDAVFYPDQTSTAYTLPEGFVITDLSKSFDPRQYFRILWRGFNHEIDGEGKFDEVWNPNDADLGFCEQPAHDMSLKVAVVAPDGNFAAFCGMWYDCDAGFAVIEPVATDPDYRLRGLGRAVVLEGIRRVEERGAKKIYVGSTQQFYYSIGFRPCPTAALWKRSPR